MTMVARPRMTPHHGQAAHLPRLVGQAAAAAQVADGRAGVRGRRRAVDHGRSTRASGTLDRLVELTHEVDFAAFVFAQDDWTSATSGDPGTPVPGQASPRDNVVFEAGLFGGALGMRRTFILHANGAKLPTDLLGLTCVRYAESLTPQELKTVNQKVREAMAAQGRLARIEGDWWQYSLSARSEVEPSAVSLLRISRDRAGSLEVKGRSWQEDGTLSARYWSEATKEQGRPGRHLLLPPRASGRGTRTRRGSRGPARSSSSPIDRAVGEYTIRVDDRAPAASARRVSTCVPTTGTGPSSTRAASTSAGTSSASDCATGTRTPTASAPRPRRARPAPSG